LVRIASDNAFEMRPFISRKLLFVCLCVFSLPVISADSIYFGIIGSGSKDTLMKIWSPFLKDMSNKTGYEVEPVIFNDYAGAINAMKEKRINLAWMGNKSAIEAVDNADAQVFAQVTNVIGVPGYYSVLITHDQSGFQGYEDVMKKASEITFGFGDIHSTSGTTVPKYYLFSQKGYSYHDFKQVNYARHESNFNDIVNQKLDVATISSGWMQRFRELYPEKIKNVKILWKSPLIPSDPFIWHKSLDEDIKKKLKTFFFNYARSKEDKTQTELQLEKKNLSNLKWSGFIPSHDGRLKYIRILSLNAELDTLKNDKKLDQAFRDAKIEKIQHSIEKLNTEM